MRFVLGVDGGGTRTRLVLASLAGKVLGTGESGPGNYHDMGPDRLREHLAEAYQRAQQVAGVGDARAAAAFVGLAGVATPTDYAEVAEVARSLDACDPARIEVGHDLSIALAGGLAGRPGIALIVGTGASCFGRSAAGRTWRAGGWGSFLDDRGASFDLGRQALVAAVRAEDGRGPVTSLTAAVLDTFDVSDLREVLVRVDAEGLARTDVAALAPLVTAAAGTGDSVAQRIIEDGVVHLAECVGTVARHIQEREPEVTTVGGLAHCGPVYKEPLRRAILAAVPGASVVDPELPPALGAVLKALELTDTPVTTAHVQALRAHAGACP